MVSKRLACADPLSCYFDRGSHGRCWRHPISLSQPAWPTFSIAARVVLCLLACPGFAVLAVDQPSQGPKSASDGCALSGDFLCLFQHAACCLWLLPA